MGKMIGWRGHGNLGDEAMAEIIDKRLGHLHWDIFGGGTLLSQTNEFIEQVSNPENTIAISIGVAPNWEGKDAGVYRRFRKIYTRDYYSHYKLLEHGVPNVLSVDIMCALEKQTAGVERKWINLLKTDWKEAYFNQMIDIIRDTATGYTPFALSMDNDLSAIPNARVYTDAQELVNDLSGGEVIATRLHANVLAWVAEAKIIPICYDTKVGHFFERVAGLTPKEARKIINTHIEDICHL